MAMVFIGCHAAFLYLIAIGLNCLLDNSVQCLSLRMSTKGATIVLVSFNNRDVVRVLNLSLKCPRDCESVLTTKV